MPKYADNLSYLDIKNISKAGIYAIGHLAGFCIRVYATGSRSYCLRYVFQNKSKCLIIGNFDILEFNEALNQARKYRDYLARGIDPQIVWHNDNYEYIRKLEDKIILLSASLTNSEQMTKLLNERAQRFAYQYEPNGVNSNTSQDKADDVKKITFMKAFDLYLSYLEECGTFDKNPRAYSEKKAMIVNHVLPVIGKGFYLADFTPNDIHKVLCKIWSKHGSLSEKLYQVVNNFISWACVNGYYNDLQFKAKLESLMTPYKRKKAERGHNPCLHYSRIPDFCKKLWSIKSVPSLCFLFSILTASRSQAVRLLTWEQIDFNERTWEIPLDNDKSKVKNRMRTIILSKQAIGILNFLKNSGYQGQFVFPNIRTGSSLSENCFNAIIKQLNNEYEQSGEELLVDYDCLDDNGNPRTITQHGTARSSFKTWTKSDVLENLGKFDSEAVEMCLLHERKDPLKGAYDRSNLLLERRKIMEAWGEYCCKFITEFKLC